MTKKAIQLLSVFSLITQFGYSQIRYDIHIQTGVSNLIETNYENINLGVDYDFAPSFTIGSDVHIQLKQGLFRIVSGVELSLLQTKSNDLVIQKKWKERYYRIGIPIQIDYAFEKWLHLKLGVINNISLGHSKEVNYGLLRSFKVYNLTLKGGADFHLIKRYIIGLQYNRDINSFAKIDNYAISYGFEQVVLKLGYIFN